MYEKKETLENNIDQVKQAVDWNVIVQDKSNEIRHSQHESSCQLTDWRQRPWNHSIQEES